MDGVWQTMPYLSRLIGRRDNQDACYRAPNDCLQPGFPFWLSWNDDLIYPTHRARPDFFVGRPLPAPRPRELSPRRAWEPIEALKADQVSALDPAAIVPGVRVRVWVEGDVGTGRYVVHKLRVLTDAPPR
jgi:hypothetical protein